MTIPGAFVAGVPLPAADLNLLPAGLRGGGYAQITANQTTITTTVDVTGLTVTFTAVAARRYQVLVQVEVSVDNVTAIPLVIITDAANTQKGRGVVSTLSATGSAHTLRFSVNETGLSGSTTRKVRASRAAGAGNVSIEAGATFPAFICVTDIGPA